MIRIVLALCAAEVLTMAGMFAFPALLPEFTASWGLSATEAGWISGITFAGYAVAVPLLSALTDRVDARRVFLAGIAVAGLAALGFGLAAEGFWSAMLFRALGGVGLAGTYMPGLKALVDRTSGPSQPHWMSWYTASFSLGTSASFLFAGWAADAFGWRAAFVLSAVACLGGIALVVAIVRPVTPPPAPRAALLDLRPAFANRPVMGYVLGYAAHMWELFGLRSWMVAYLAFALSLAPAARGPSPTTAAMLSSLVAMAASIGGASLAIRFGRRRLCILSALASAATALVLGFAAPLPYLAVVFLMVAYNGLVQLDSASLTTGAVLEADPGRRGATIAVHSLIGFGAAFVGPLAFGRVLDAAGGTGSVMGWGLAFASLGLVSALGPIALRRLVPGR
ncbi:MAG: MFS transporter [Solirubrobacterales bacterium]